MQNRSDIRHQDDEPKVIAISATREAATASLIRTIVLASAAYGGVSLLLHSIGG